ncbi:MAG: hypothetical protein AAGE52_31090 [Myxococcota bacterium]
MRWGALVLLPFAVSASAQAPADGADALGAPPPSSTVTTAPDPTAPGPTAEAQTPSETTPVNPPANPPRAPFVIPPGYEQSPQPTVQPAYAPYASPIPQRRRRVRVRYEEGMEIPPDARVFERRSRFLLIPGLIAFAVSYSLSIGAAASGADNNIAVPFLGPILWQLDNGDSDTAPTMALLSIAQVAGMFLFSLGLRKKTYVEYWTVGNRRISAFAGATPNGGSISLRIW